MRVVTAKRDGVRDKVRRFFGIVPWWLWSVFASILLVTLLLAGALTADPEGDGPLRASGGGGGSSPSPSTTASPGGGGGGGDGGDGDVPPGGTETATRTTTTTKTTTDTDDPGNEPPNAPSNPSPPHMAQTQDFVSLTLAWQGGDPDGDSVEYEAYLELGSQAPSVSVCTWQASLSCTVSNLEPDSTYSWRVVARDGSSSRQGPVWSFETRVQDGGPEGNGEDCDLTPKVCPPGL